MDNSNVALITKLVLEAVEKQKSSDDAGYLVPIGQLKNRNHPMMQDILSPSECPQDISILHRNTSKCCLEKAISSPRKRS